MDQVAEFTEVASQASLLLAGFDKAEENDEWIASVKPKLAEIKERLAQNLGDAEELEAKRQKMGEMITEARAKVQKLAAAATTSQTLKAFTELGVHKTALGEMEAELKRLNNEIEGDAETEEDAYFKLGPILREFSDLWPRLIMPQYESLIQELAAMMRPAYSSDYEAVTAAKSSSSGEAAKRRLRAQMGLSGSGNHVDEAKLAIQMVTRFLAGNDEFADLRPKAAAAAK